MLDFHSHLIPGVDDGAADIDESRAGLETLRQQGVRQIITTPHLRASSTLARGDAELQLQRIDEGFAKLQALVGDAFPSLTVARGAELALDVPAPDISDPRLRLAGSRFVLVEFPYLSIPPHSAVVLRRIAADGHVPIVAHPERYANMPSDADIVGEWRDAGAFVQVNSGSLVGQYGTRARRLAWLLLEDGLADYLSSDYHSRGRCLVSEASEALLERGAAEELERLTVVNPGRILTDELPVEMAGVPPAREGILQRLFKRG